LRTSRVGGVGSSWPPYLSSQWCWVRPRSVDPEAYAAYLKGRHFMEKWTEEETRIGREYFEQAIQKDPNYALPYAGLADSYVWGRAGLPPEEAFRRARTAATKALELDDTLGEPHAALAQIKFTNDWDWAGAEAEFKRAIELNPNDTNALHMYSHYLLSMGRVEESYAITKRALQHDPLSPAMQLHLGFQYLTARQYHDAIPAIPETSADRSRLPGCPQSISCGLPEKGDVRPIRGRV